MAKNTENGLMKFNRDLLSVKIWVIALGTSLLLARYIGANDWVYLCVGVICAREIASYRHSKFGSSNSTDEDFS